MMWMLLRLIGYFMFVAYFIIHLVIEIHF
jgi:hypothetical protein